MNPVSELLARIREGISTLTPPEAPIVPVRFAVRRVVVTRFDGRTLDVELEVYCHLVPEIEYADLKEYWALVTSLLKGSGHPGLKAKALLEFRSALAMYDRTLDERQAPRDRIFEDLKELTLKLTQAAQDPEIELFEGITTSARQIEEQLKMNAGELSAILFSRPEEIERTYAHLVRGDFAARSCRTQLKGLAVRLM